MFKSAFNRGKFEVGRTDVIRIENENEYGNEFTAYRQRVRRWL